MLTRSTSSVSATARDRLRRTRASRSGPLHHHVAQAGDGGLLGEPAAARASLVLIVARVEHWISVADAAGGRLDPLASGRRGGAAGTRRDELAAGDGAAIASRTPAMSSGCMSVQQAAPSSSSGT